MIAGRREVGWIFSDLGREKENRRTVIDQTEERRESRRKRKKTETKRAPRLAPC